MAAMYSRNSGAVRLGVDAEILGQVTQDPAQRVGVLRDIRAVPKYFPGARPV